MQFPADEVLLARGRYSTLSHARHDQLKRVQNICTTIVTEAQAALRDCEQIPPVNSAHLATLEKCMENLQDAREKLVELTGLMVPLKVEAWE